MQTLGFSHRWRLSGWYFFYFALIGAFSPYFTLYLQSLGLAAASIAALMSLMSAMRLLAPNLWGWLAERSGRTLLVLRASALLSMVGFTGFFFTEAFWPLFAAMAAMSFFWSAVLPLVEALTEKLNRENGIPADTSDVVVVNGGMQGLFGAFQSVVNAGDDVLMFSPYWTPIRDLICLTRGTPVRIDTAQARREGFRRTIEASLTAACASACTFATAALTSAAWRLGASTNLSTAK